MWPHAFIAGLARRLGLGSPASTASCHPESAAIFGTAQTMNQKPLRGATPNLERRALIYYNRDQAKAERYLRMHDLLRQSSVTFLGDET